MGDRGWRNGRPGDDDEWVRPVQAQRPRRPGGGPRDTRGGGGDRSGFWSDAPAARETDAVYAGPQYPRELASYGARRDPTDPRGHRSGDRMAVPAPRWQIADGLPTVPTALIAGAAVVLAFLIGHLSGGGGGSSTSTAATTPTVATVATTSTLPANHTVGVGENLSSIANLYGLTTQDLAAYNNISNINHVFVGEVLKIPPPTVPTTAVTPTTKKK